jgi:hypothetical protein
MGFLRDRTSPIYGWSKEAPDECANALVRKRPQPSAVSGAIRTECSWDIVPLACRGAGRRDGRRQTTYPAGGTLGAPVIPKLVRKKAPGGTGTAPWFGAL